MPIVGPLFWKELIESARRIRYYAIRSIVAGAVLTTLLALSEPLAKHQVSQLSSIGRALFEKWAWVQLIALTVFAPAFTCGLIAGEKDHKTIDALFTSCVSDREILWGKLASRIYVTGVIVASSVPVIVLLSFLGGFGLKELFEYALLQTATAVLCAAIGLYYSVISSKPYVALIRAYFVLVVVWLIVPMLAVPITDLWPFGVLMGWRRNLAEVVTIISMCINPFVWLRNQGGSTVFPGVTLKWTPPAYGFVAFATLFSTLAIQRSQLILREAVYWNRVPRVWRWMTQTYSWLLRRISDAVERRRTHGFWRQLWDWEIKSRRWGNWEQWYGLHVNPLVYRRATANVYDPERYIAGLQALAWLIVLIILLVGGYVEHRLLGDSRNFIIMLSAELPMLALVLVVLTASSIAREADRGSLDLLLLTSLNPGEILTGTLWGIFRTAWPAFVLVAITMLVGGMTTLHEWALIEWAFTVMPMLMSIIAGCMLITVAARRTMVAVIVSLVPPLWFVGVPILFESLGAAQGPSALMVALIAVVALISARGFAQRRNRRPLVLAILMAIFIPLFCLLTAFCFSGGWSGEYGYGTRQISNRFTMNLTYRSFEGPWPQINYAHRLLGPLLESRFVRYYQESLNPAAFGIAQLFASAWMFYLVRNDLKTMLGGSTRRSFRSERLDIANRTFQTSDFNRYGPVRLAAQRETSSGLPATTTVPPPSPPSGPKSIT